MEHQHFFSRKTGLQCLFFVFFCLPFLSLGQGEWRWAKSYTGKDAFGGSINNEIICADFDSDGNIYIMGTFGYGAAIEDEQILHDSVTGRMLSHMQSLGMGGHFASDAKGTIIVKFSPQGELIWKKVIRFNEYATRPSWMELRGDRIYFLGQVTHGNATYYLDTLVLEYTSVHEDSLYLDKPIPYRHQWFNCFLTFDLDGNLVDERYLRMFQRESGFPLYHKRVSWWLSERKNPFHVDKNGNIYILANIDHFGGPIEEPITIVVDEEKEFDFYTLRACAPLERNSEWMLFKFSSEWDLVWYKQLVHHTTGVNLELMPSEPNGYLLNVNNMSFDEEDNLYICGNLMMGANGIPSGYHTYPLKVYWDSVQYANIPEIYATNMQSVMCKYDTSGNVLWTKQLHHFDTGTVGMNSDFCDISIAGNKIYSFGFISASRSENPQRGVYIDEEHTIPIGREDSQQSCSFFIEYDRETGEYINHSFVPAERHSIMLGTASVINNHIVISNRKGLALDTCFIAYLRDDGMLMATTELEESARSSKDDYGNVRIHESGKLFFHMVVNKSITIGDFYLPHPGDNDYSMVVFGMMDDPSLVIPYDYDSDGIDHFSTLEEQLSLVPNPTQGKLFISGYIKGFQKMELYDLSGRKLSESQTYEFDLASYAAGSYLVKIYFKEGKTVTRKVIKTNRE